MSFTPTGSVDGDDTITIRFDKPVVEPARVAQGVEPEAVTVAPEFAWKGFWQDQRTLVIDPVAPLARSTRYDVALAGELARRSSGFHFNFVSHPIAVEGLSGVDANMLPLDGELPLAFNQPVVPDEAAKHCKLVGDAGAIALAATSKEPTPIASLKPAAALAAGGSYTLTCSGITGAGGNTPLAAPFTTAVRGRPVLSVASVSPAGQAVGADEVELVVKFSTPVALDSARKAIRAVPGIPKLAQGYMSGDGTEYHATADLDTETDYKIKVAGLTDVFGQQLAKPYEHKFRTADALPRISMERGIFALEASAKGYPVWTRNVKKFAVECAAIPRGKLVQLLTTDMNYDPWGGNNDNQDLDWKKLGTRGRKTTIKPAGKNKWRLDELDLGATCANAPGQRGVYLAEVSSDEVVPDDTRYWSHRRNRVLANVTDLGILIKAGTASGLVWVTSLASGAPVAGAKVAVFTPQGKQVWTDTTSADGLVTIPGSAILKNQKAQQDPEAGEYADWDSFRAQRLIAIVEHDSDLAVVDGNWSNGIQIWNFGVPEDRRGGSTKIRGFIQSDRGLYRPGETVHFKGIARQIGQGLPPSIPDKKVVAVEVQDSRGQVVHTSRTRLSAFGGFAFDLPLGEEATLGDYYVSATVADQVFRERFQVEEFRPAAFELGLKSGSASPRPGERLTFELDAKYLFGAPVANAKVEWGLRKRPHPLQFAGFEEFSFSADPDRWWWYSYRDRDDYGEFVANGEGTTNARGRLAITSRDTAKKFDGPIDYILSTSVTDSSDQTMGKSTIVTAHKTALYLGVHANEYVQAVGMPFGVNLVAVTPAGTRTDANAKLTFTRVRYDCSWSSSGYRSYESCTAHEQPMITRDVAIAATGTAMERIYPTEPGEYLVKAEAKDARGNAVVAASHIYVIGKGEAFWSGDEGDRMTLIASKASYRAGETARLVAQANLVKPTALITVERDGVISAKVVQLASASEGIELPIADAWAPNVFASVALVSGRQGPGDAKRPRFKMGLVELKVSTDHKQLEVGVSLDQTTVRPGDKVIGKIKVTQGGAPVKAEVSLSVADEGVLQLISYQTPNPMKTFYATYGLGVDSGTNWNRVARLADPNAGDPDIGGDAGSALNGQRVRSKFVSSAFWAPMLVTDDNGEIPFSFTAPDNLTAFRLMAVAADAGDRFGAGELRLTVNKPLMAAPALPRFLRAADAASVGIVVHNNTDEAGAATVTARSSGAWLDRSTQIVQVPAHGSTRVRFAAKAAETAAATFEFAVALGAERDAVRVTLPVERPRVIDARMLVEQKLGKGETWTGSVAVGPDVLRKESTLAITVDRTGVGELAPGLRALVEYPYGCLEQTMSRFIPLVAAKDLARTLDDPALQGTRANQFIRAGVAKVIRHQQGDGMFSLWPQSQTYPHLAAYALWGLTVAQQAGERVPDEVFDRGIKALVDWANTSGTLKPDGDGATAAMAAYVMAMRGKPDASLNARLFALRAGLPKWGQAFLLRALKLAKAPADQVQTLHKQIEAGIKLADGRASMHETFAGYEYEHYMTSDVRAAAMTLAALLEVDPSSSLIEPLAAGLKAGRTRDGTWASTQENLWSLVALAEYGRRAAGGSTTITVTAGGKQVVRRKITGGEIATTKLRLSDLASDEIKISADQGAVISARLSEARADAGAPSANGFAISRRYLDAAGNEQTSFKAGDLVTVRLNVHADAARKWVALVDPLPAGFEVINSKLAAGGAQDQDQTPQQRQSYWAQTTWIHQEIRDDRVLWFADSMYGGDHELTYQARATIDGTFTAQPASIEAMYDPTLHARTARATVTIAK